MCLDGLRTRELGQSPMMCQPYKDGKAWLESIFVTSTIRETEHDAHLFGKSLQILSKKLQGLKMYLQVLTIESVIV